MQKLLFTILFFILAAGQVRACCAENIYRLFPMGEAQGEVILLELQMGRTCFDRTHEVINNDTDMRTFWLNGVVRLVQYRADSLVPLQVIDTLNFKDCQCDYNNSLQKSRFEEAFQPVYQKAFAVASALEDFQPAITEKLYCNDTLRGQVTLDTITYDRVRLAYQDKFTLELGIGQIISCIPDKLAETRIYTTTGFTIYVFRMRCSYLEPKAVKRNKKRFKKHATAFWKEKAQWHGIAKDFVKIVPK